MTAWAKIAAAATLCVLAGPVTGQEAEVSESAAIAVLEACLDESNGSAGCIGTAAGLCAAAQGRQGGVGICYGLESAYWDGRIAAAMNALTGPGTVAEAFAERVDWPIPQPTLANVQVTFEAYRDATCDMAGALWGNGSGAGPAWMECRMQINADHALRLEAWLESVE